MSGFSRNAMYDYVCDKVLEAFPNAYCSSAYELVPESFPAVFIAEVNHHDVKDAIDLCGTDRQWKSTFQVQVFSNKKEKMSECVEIVDVVREAFKTQMYNEDFEQTLPNIDPTIYRIVAEFSRTIGSGDEMK